MFAMFKLCAILVLAAPFASALSIATVSGNAVSEGSLTITWNTASDDAAGTFSIELDHPSFVRRYDPGKGHFFNHNLQNNALAIASNVDSSSLSITINLPNVPAEDGYTIEFVDISNINAVYSKSNTFAIGAVSATQSTTVKAAPSSTSKSSSNSASGSGSGSATGVPISSDQTPSVDQRLRNHRIGIGYPPELRRQLRRPQHHWYRRRPRCPQHLRRKRHRCPGRRCRCRRRRLRALNPFALIKLLWGRQ
ncbi:hypothetical protein C8R43DRAFT_568863 [Mycena crocata]|nr:hypothetical protein C8R43DRAFT_568863 [Mycena crocata]